MKLTLTEYIVSMWMKVLNFDYQSEKESYMINIYKREDVVLNWNTEYLLQFFEEELQELCQVQLSEADLKKGLRKIYKVQSKRDDILHCLVKTCSYTYYIIDKKINKFHIDAHEYFLTMCSSNPFGGFPSIRRNQTLKNTSSLDKAI